MKRRLRSSILSLIGIILAASLAAAATLTGSSTDENGAVLAGVQVTVPALQKGTTTDKDGKFSLDGVPPGSYAVQFKLGDYGTETRKVQVLDTGASVSAVLRSNPIEIAPITITAAPTPTDVLNTPAEVSVVQGRDLDQQRSESIISAIQDQPGVSMIDEGPTVVKPIIRGLSSENLVIAEDGVREEFIQWGNEHAPEIDAMSADRIEVLRGAASLMYGSDALGGVINVSHADLPSSSLGAGPLSGKLTAQANSVNNGVSQSAMLQGAQGDWGWRANLSQQQAGNFSTGNEGFIPNTGEREVSGDAAVGVSKDWGNVMGSYSHFNKYVQLQNGFVYPAQLDDQEYQVLIHDHAMLRANFLTDLARFEVIGGYDRSDRKEYNGQTACESMTPPPAGSPPGTNSTCNPVPNGDYSDLGAYWIETSYTTEVRAHLAPMGPFQGTLGFSSLVRIEDDLAPNTQLTPGYEETGFGEYLYEELPLDKFTFSAGIRGDEDHYGIFADPLVGADAPAPPNGPGPAPVAKQSLNYSAVTAALGGVYHITDPLGVAVNIGRGFRNPIPFELFGDGVHEGAGVFQVGDPNLKPEDSLNTDVSLRWASDGLKGEVGVYRNYIQDYIYGNFTGQWVPNPENPNAPGSCAAGQAGCLPEVQETQSNATLQGVDYTISGAATNWLTLTSEGSLVRGVNNANVAAPFNHNLPLIPADNVRVGAEVHEKKLGAVQNPYFGLDEKLTAPQREAPASFVPTTPGYALMGARIGGEFNVMNNKVSVDAGVNNLLNKGYIDYASLLIYYNIENPGRNVYLKVSVPFGS